MNWRLWRRKEDYTRSVLKNVQPKDRAHHSEQQDMCMTLRIIFLELEFASRNDGDHQQPAALTVLTLLGAGRQGREETENQDR